MLNWKKWLLVVSLVAGSAVAAPRMASAAGPGFFCNVQLVTGSSSLGTSGYVVLSITSGASCGGTFLSSGFICSAGATTSDCTGSGVGMKLTMDQLVAMFAAIHDAELANEKVFYVITPGAVYQQFQFMAAGYPF